MPYFSCIALGLLKKLFWCAFNHTKIYITLKVPRSICPLLHTRKVIRLKVWEHESPARPGTALRWSLRSQVPRGVRLQEPLFGVVGWILSLQNSHVEILISDISECLFGNRLITDIINKDEVLLESGKPCSNMTGALIKSLNTNLESWTKLHTHTHTHTHTYTQSTWTKNFQTFKLDLEKAEEPKIKLPTSVGSSKKQENSRKTSTFAYWLYQSLWLCRSQQTMENSLRDGNTRLPYLPPEKSVCRSRSNT